MSLSFEAIILPLRTLVPRPENPRTFRTGPFTLVFPPSAAFFSARCPECVGWRQYRRALLLGIVVYTIDDSIVDGVDSYTVEEGSVVLWPANARRVRKMPEKKAEEGGNNTYDT